MLKRIFPHPYLTLTLTIVWLMLANAYTATSLVFGLILGIIIPILTAPYWSDRPTVRNIPMIIEYVLLVLYDIVVANIAVARIVLFMRNKDMRPAWITVPTDLTSPEAVTVLAGTITMTPGTVSAELSTDGRSILVHCLHAPDPDSVRDEIKSRYERRLKEIFE
ncbi:Na+/H+ antiporter subunit E [Phaeovulum sp. NW3]|uniref:Na+/H+ antiporter subunit E n=1 Tax=Phaeovulum sp. NW3 TaxID=2934933 RepID=UPI0020213AEA|nr:Na+/H+ antiporter subunit E [Phaeovulum sp. NW3]MCL7463856.1 Na+/H+ antiporter subunit E [Phaeovulum sp. NW3]